MRVASTGLGTSELVADTTGMKPDGNLMALHAMATSPAAWHLETCLEPKDVWPVVKGFLRPSIVWVIVLSFILFWKQGSEPENL
jgi:hypothetical protein